MNPHSTSLSLNMEENQYKKGAWAVEEDSILMDYVHVNGKGRWNRISRLTGLRRRGKSCRLRWMNHLCPNVKKDEFSEQEEDLIIRLHNLLGNRWSLIAGRLPGRTDNQVKNYWKTHLSKKQMVKKDMDNGSVPSGSGSVSQHSEKDEDFNRPQDMTSNHLSYNGDFGAGRPELSADLQDLLMNEGLMTPFYSSNDNLYLNTPSLLEQIDGCPLDVVWNNFFGD